MTITYEDLYVLLEPMRELYATSLPIRVSLKIKKLLKVLEDEEKLVSPERNKMMEQWCKKSEDGRVFIFPKPGEENFDGFMADYQDFFNSKFDFPYEKIDLDMLENDSRFANVVISGKTLGVIERLNEMVDVKKKPEMVISNPVDVAAEVQKLEDAEYSAPV
jgi:hypothetical protein